MVWVYQETLLGTGHAVLKAKNFASNELFIVCAGDTLIIGNNVFIQRIKYFEKYKTNFMTVILVKDPKRYGIIKGEKLKKEY